MGQAVAASCAVPGYFKPVTIGGRRYVDGGLRSFTNMDLVAGSGLDLVIVSAPMSQASGWPAVSADTLLRQSLGARLRSEVAALRRAGVPVVTIEPDRQVARAMGLNPMDARPRGEVSRATRRRVGDWLSGLATAGGWPPRWPAPARPRPTRWPGPEPHGSWRPPPTAAAQQDGRSQQASAVCLSVVRAGSHPLDEPAPDPHARPLELSPLLPATARHHRSATVTDPAHHHAPLATVWRATVCPPASSATVRPPSGGGPRLPRAFTPPYPQRRRRRGYSGRVVTIYVGEIPLSLDG